ncbi:hypothetical protein PGIGA_G00101280 [Pangasianodon gigas]|uniref:Uncharacterized protein n=1 Tax=Pangasianodon gigas TaxID=30993 RepID=A0ACC5XEY6_PANGG|nr:hypothetical protein [Pangasianodon gigas]
MDWKQTDRSREDSKHPAPCALWPVDLKLTHTDCNPGNTLVHFQGQYATICELDYNILQVEIQNVPKTTVSMEVGDLCLVEDLLSSRWYRGRVQNKSGDLFDVFLLDHGNILTVGPKHLSTISDSLLMLPPKIVCGFIANVLPVQECWDQPSEAYFSSLIGRHIKGYIHGLLPYKVLILEVPEITKDLLRLSLGRHVDTDTFLLLVELVIEVPIQQSSESVPDLLIEKQIAQEISFKSSNLCGYENILSLSGPKLVVGQKERVRIAAAVNPGLFYCQLSSAAKDLKEMSEKLALVCESRNGDFRDRPGENLGLLCAIKGKDEKWHRGFVQCLPVNSQVRVVFVDYGYCESVKVENIIQLPSDFLLRPVMTFPCSLSCLGGKDKATVNQQLVLLRKGLLGKELVITVDDLSKEKNVCSVTLSNVVECALIKTVQSKEVDKMTSTDILTNVHPLCYIPNETKKVGISKNLVAFEHIQDGSVFEGYVEHVQSPHDFWMRTAKSNDRFEAMMNRLTDRFSRLQLNEETLQDPVPGQLCCAMYEKDMHYYRALVVDILEYGAEVFFIDFGNTEKVPSMLIKKIPTEFTVEPEFAFNCSLAHVVPLEDVWTATATDFFRNATSNKALLVHVIYRRSDVFVVELYEKGFEKTERDLVAARYDEDLALYRAAVNSVASSGYLTVEFVDYGNTATVDKKKIHPLASKFLSEARLSTHCKLSKPYNLEDVESFLSDTHDKPLMVEFVQNLGYAWEVSIQGLAPSNESRESDPAGGKEDKVPDSGQAKQRQELYAAVHEDDTALTSICEKTEADTASIIEETKKFESGTKDSKMVQEKTLEKVQATRATGCMQKLRTKRKACAYKCKCDEKQDVCQSDLPQKPEINIRVAENELLNISNNSCGWSGSNTLKTSVELPESVGVDGQDITVKKCQSVVHQPTSEGDCPAPLAIPPEKPMDKEDEIRHLFLAPVKKDHEYSGFAAAVTTPGEFYIVLENLLLIMNAVSNILEDLPEDLAPLPEAHLIPGTGCLVKSEEKKKWCRAEIIQCNDISVIINLVDYGYCVHLACQDVCNLKALPVELAGLPKITYPCLLRGIKPADELQWSDNAAMFFQQCMHQKNLKIHFRQYVSDAQWEVDVVTSNRNVAKELVDAGHAHYIDTVLGIRFQHGLGHKWEIKSNSVENVSEAVSGKHEQTQSKMEKVPHRYLEDVSSNDDEEISEGCSTEGETEDPFSGRSDKHGSAQKTYYGLQSRLSQCVNGLQ